MLQFAERLAERSLHAWCPQLQPCTPTLPLLLCLCPASHPQVNSTPRTCLPQGDELLLIGQILAAQAAAERSGAALDGRLAAAVAGADLTSILPASLTGVGGSGGKGGRWAAVRRSGGGGGGPGSAGGAQGACVHLLSAGHQLLLAVVHLPACALRTPLCLPAALPAPPAQLHGSHYFMHILRYANKPSLPLNLCVPLQPKPRRRSAAS